VRLSLSTNNLGGAAIAATLSLLAKLLPAGIPGVGVLNSLLKLLIHASS